MERSLMTTFILSQQLAVTLKINFGEVIYTLYFASKQMEEIF